MTSVASNSPDFSDSSKDYKDSAAKETPPQRPKLVSPPKRPQRPPEPQSVPQTENLDSQKAAPSQVEPDSRFVEPPPETEEASNRLQPIAPPSEPMQYRAIGTVRGAYAPESEDQFNRGYITTEDGGQIEAVLLGRVTSLVKNHLDLNLSHLWVVYPRTRQSEETRAPELHLQIVGVWEPETLGLPGEAPVANEATAEPPAAAESDTAAPASPEEDASSTPAPEQPASEVDSTAESPTESKAEPEQLPDVDDNYFSIRGEILKYEEEQQLISIKILQNPRRGSTTRKAFRLTVQGKLEGRTVGYFWDLDVKREDSTLVLDAGKPIGIVPPKKKRRKSGGKGGPPRRGGGGSRRPPSGSARPRPQRHREDSKEHPRAVVKRSDRDS